MPSIETLIKNSCKSLGEGPHWDDKRGQLLYVDLFNGTAHRWTAATGEDEQFTFETDCSSMIVPCSEGGYIVSTGKSLCHFDWDTKKVTHIATVDKDMPNKINDGKCDSTGRLWFGTYASQKEGKFPPHQGSLYSLELDGTIRKHEENITLSNGLAWSADNKIMFYIDSFARKLYRYDFDVNAGTISNRQVVLNNEILDTISPRCLPDGMTVDTDDKLWVACFGASKVVRFDPNSGRVIQSVELPATNITSCCFGGKNFDELFITCGSVGLSKEELQAKPLTGSVFRVTDLGTRGTPANIYRGSIPL